MTTGERIKLARKNSGLTQAALGLKLGVSGSMIAQYETGKRNPKYGTIKRIADLLKIEWTDLVPENERGQIEIDYIRDGLKKGEERSWELMTKQDLEFVAFNDYLESIGFKLVIELDTFDNINPNHYWTLYDLRNQNRYFVPSETLNHLQTITTSFVQYHINEVVSNLGAQNESPNPQVPEKSGE